MALFLILVLLTPVNSELHAQGKKLETGTIGNPDGKEESIEGFRSAKFGMTVPQVRQAIMNDFGLKGKALHREANPTEKTENIWINLKDIPAESGPLKVYYIFGYKSKKLVQVNIVWGKPVTDNPDSNAIVAIANQLRDYFLNQKYDRKKMIANAPLGDGLILVFRALDSRGRMIALLLSNLKTDKNAKGGNTMLKLSYIQKPESPDVYRINPGTF